MFDENNNEIGMVKEKVLSFLPQFDIEIGGMVLGKIQKQFTFFRPKYDVDFNGWHVEGDFWGWDYDVYEGCSSIIHINKELLHWGDIYVIDFANPEDELMGLMLVVAIDAANCTESSNC